MRRPEARSRAGAELCFARPRHHGARDDHDVICVAAGEPTPDLVERGEEHTGS